MTHNVSFTLDFCITLRRGFLLSLVYGGSVQEFHPLVVILSPSEKILLHFPPQFLWKASKCSQSMPFQLFRRRIRV